MFKVELEAGDLGEYQSGVFRDWESPWNQETASSWVFSV